MSAFTSETELANLALAEIGAKRITNLDTDTSAEAVTCRQHFAHVRNTLLRSHPWSFAKKTLALSQSATAPVASAEWDAAWALPGDMVRLIRVVGPSADLPLDRFEIAGQFLHTRGQSTITIVYVTHSSPVNEWDDLFVDALRFKLASEIAGTLTGNPQAGNDALTKYKNMALPDAARVDAQGDASGENRTAYTVAAQSGLVQARFRTTRPHYSIQNP